MHDLQISVNMRVILSAALFNNTIACFWSNEKELQDKPPINDAPATIAYNPKIRKTNFKSKAKVKSAKKSPEKAESSKIKTEYFVSDEPSSMCKNTGGWGQPCR